jgi:thiol-disulfide isomerase/thioredoxin
MVFLAGGAIIAIALTILNLLLTFGVIRRLREHTEQLSQRPGMGSVPDLMLGVGESPESFTATTTDNEQISLETLGEQLVGFFSPSCGPCKEKAPLFAERAGAGPRTATLAVVLGSPDEARELVARFEPVARVVVESDTETGSVSKAFKVKGFPAICTLDGDGVVTASGFEMTNSTVPSLVS